MMKTTSKQPDTALNGAVIEKWGEAAKAGFQAIPDLLFKHQRTLSINATELVVLLNVLMHWWYRDQKPFPRSSTIARRMGSDIRTVQRALSRLEELELIERTKGPKKDTTYVDPQRLVAKLEILAMDDPDYLVRTQGRSGVAQQDRAPAGL